MQEHILKLADYWAHSPVFDENTRKEIGDLLAKNNEAELTERFYRDLEFGTGGLRGILGAGTARMNIFNVRKASQAFARYLQESFPQKKISIAISYDSRNFSREFAEATASHGSSRNSHLHNKRIAAYSHAFLHGSALWMPRRGMCHSKS